MVWLPDGEKFFKDDDLLISTDYTSMTDGWTDRRTPHDSIGSAYE